MTNLAPHATPCARCHQPHPARIAADGQRTYRHADGHPYQPAEQPAPKPAALHGRYQVTDFGRLVVCVECQPSWLGVNHHRHITDHDRYHEE